MSKLQKVAEFAQHHSNCIKAAKQSGFSCEYKVQFQKQSYVTCPVAVIISLCLTAECMKFSIRKLICSYLDCRYPEDH